MGAEVRLYVHDVVIRGGEKLYGCRDAEDIEILAAALPLVRAALQGAEQRMAVLNAIDMAPAGWPDSSMRRADAAIAAVLRILEAEAAKP